jgi:hypothetical protein
VTRGVPVQSSRRQRRKKNCRLSSMPQEAQPAEDAAVEEALREDEESADDQDRFADPWVEYLQVMDDNSTCDL